MRLDLLDPFRANLFEALHPVDGAALEQVVEPRHLALVEGHDDLADPAKRDVVLGAVRLQLGLARPTQSGLERAGLVVQARMHHAAVVAGLVHRDFRLTLEDHQP